MAKKLLAIEVRGKLKSWSFHFEGDPKYLDEWRDDGLTVNEVINVIPEWVADIGMVRPWCFMQDLLCGYYLGRLVAVFKRGCSKL